MGEFITKFRSQISEILEKWDRRKKIMYLGGGGLAILLIVVLVMFFTRTEYVALATNLSIDDAARITTALTELGIPFKDENNATVILVPKESLSKAKMQLTLNGSLTQKDFDWAQAFGSTSLSYTSEDKMKMYELAQENALAETIMTLDGVQKAKVNLTVPSDSVFLLSDDAVSKASVTLMLKNGYRLNAQQVNGIVMILVNSVRGLDAAHVSIVDNTGRVLNEQTDFDGDITANTQHDMQMQVAQKLEKDLHKFLATIFGDDGVRVMASVRLDFDSKITESKIFSVPVEGETTGLIRSMTDIQEKTVNADASGVPGTDSNPDVTGYAENSQGSNQYQKASKTINYEMNETLTKVEKAKGTITDITVSVIINQEQLVDNVLTEAQKKDIVDLVSAAAGLDAKVVNVSAQTFAKVETDFTDLEQTTTHIPIWIVVVGLALIATVVAVAFVLMKKRAQKKREEELAQLEEEQQQEIENIKLQQEDDASPKVQIERFIDANPEVVAQLLRAWLNDD